MSGQHRLFILLSWFLTLLDKNFPPNGAVQFSIQTLSILFASEQNLLPVSAVI